MAKFDISPLIRISGFVAAALVDSDSGLMLAGVGTAIKLEVGAAGNAEVVKYKRKVAAALKLNDQIEDILVTLGKQYHLIRPLEGHPNLFLYIVFDRSRTNLAMARQELKSFEPTLRFT